MKKTSNSKDCPSICSVCHPNNPCSGKYGDCLDVIFTNYCNAKCSFCVQRNNKHYVPLKDISPNKIIEIINKHPAKNILLVGGEPTFSSSMLYLSSIINKKIYLTTNGSNLSKFYVENRNFQLLSGLNISIHSPDENVNFGIFDFKAKTRMPEFQDIRNSVKWLKEKNPSMNIRINANLFGRGINSFKVAKEMVNLARYLEVDSIRFAELQGVSFEDGFVFAKDIFTKESILLEDPFTSGCETSFKIDNFPVTVRRVCGIVSKNLPPVINPIGRKAKTQVLHPDGVITEGFTGLPDCHKDKKSEVGNLDYHISTDTNGRDCHCSKKRSTDCHISTNGSCHGRDCHGGW